MASNFVLTARHCTIDATTRIVFANGHTHKIIGYFSPPRRYRDGGDERDLALLKMDDEVPGPVAELANNAITPQNGSVAWIAGLGFYYRSTHNYRGIS